MNKDDKIFIAGHRGLVGSAILHNLECKGYENFLIRTSKELNLTNQTRVRAFFQDEKPTYVFLSAAKVGGILANNNYPAEFIHQNLVIQTNIIHESYNSGVKRLLFLGSSCIYPKECLQPIKEEYLLTGPLESTNRPYALAKIAGIEMCWAYNRQFGTQYIAAMPTNLFGPGDNYDLEKSHVIPALIRKIHEAKMNNSNQVVIWGTGTPYREFLYNEELADACVFIMNLEDNNYSLLINENEPPLVNIGSGKDLQIKDLAELIKKVVGYDGELLYDTSKPDGTTQKLLNTNKISRLGWQPRLGLKEGLKLAYCDFQKNHT